MENTKHITVRELAKACKVSRQTIYNIVKEIKKEYPPDKLYQYIAIVDNVTSITSAGQKLIKERLNIDPAADEIKKVDPVEDPETTSSQLIIEILQKQLEIKDEQIREYQRTIRAMQQQESERNALKALEFSDAAKSGIFQRFLRIFKGDNNEGVKSD